MEIPETDENMKRFSLILCTVNRDQVVREYFESLVRQKDPPSFEVILIDQNRDDRLLPIIADFEKLFPIRRYTSTPGLSHARNLALNYAVGEIIAFPDDDCTYPETLLKSVSDYLSAEHIDGVSTLVTDQHGRLSVGFMHRSSRRISCSNVWSCGVSISIFIKRQAVGDIRFDESLGVGSGTVYGSGEETDFLLNLLKERKLLDFCPDIVVNHPLFFGPWTVKRGYSYGSGMGRVLRKHNYTVFRVFYVALLQWIRALMALGTLNFPRMIFHLAMAHGRLTGYFRK